MAKDSIPEWLSDEIQNAKFTDSTELERTGYILEIYDADCKADTQLYDPIEDGRHIVTMDMSEGIKISELEKGVVYKFVFDQHKAPLSGKVSEYLEKEQGIAMTAIYKFDLKSYVSLETDPEAAGDD